MKIALICNTTAAFPLISWLRGQQLLAAIGINEQQTDFSQDLRQIAQQINQNITVLRRENLKQDLIGFVQSSQADLVLVLGCPFKIPASVLTLPKYGFFNIHFGSLPKYAGAVPVFWQIKNREPQCQLTIHKMNEKFDAGDIAIEIPFDLHKNQIYGAIEVMFGYATINGVFQLINALLGGTLTLKAQTKVSEQYTKRPQMQDMIVDFKNMSAAEIVALVKACNPWNKGAAVKFKGAFLKILEAKTVIAAEIKALPGNIILINSSEIHVACLGDETLIIQAIYTEQGYMVGENMATLGFKIGDTLG
ncbi:MAG: hypothetical protein KA327_08620 [Pseudarcicella sp.]|nr:hypothetical protein [Pseudarcicella sp.]